MSVHYRTVAVMRRLHFEKQVYVYLLKLDFRLTEKSLSIATAGI
jgi:hypothetical protein